MTLIFQVLSLYTFLWARKFTKKEGTEENYITPFCTLNLYLSLFKLYFKSLNQYLLFYDWVFLLFTGIIPAIKTFKKKPHQFLGLLPNSPLEIQILNKTKLHPSGISAKLCYAPYSKTPWNFRDQNTAAWLPKFSKWTIGFNGPTVLHGV